MESACTTKTNLKTHNNPNVPKATNIFTTLIIVKTNYNKKEEKKEIEKEKRENRKIYLFCHNIKTLVRFTVQVNPK